MSLDRVQALVLARQLIDEELDTAVRECITNGTDRSALAHLLGVDRSTLYRRHVWTPDEKTRGGQGRPKAGEANP